MDMASEAPGLLSKSASVYEHLKRMVVRGQLRPGRRLAPTDLANQFRISKTPVSDALVRLATEGFIRAESSRGYFTKPWTVAEQRDLHELLAIHYVACLEGAEAAASVCEAAFATLASVEKAGGSPEAVAESFGHGVERLYLDLASAAGNAIVPVILANLTDRTHLIRRMDLETPDRRCSMTHALQSIARAVTGGDLSAAIPASRAHLEAMVERLPALVERANAEGQRLRFP